MSKLKLTVDVPVTLPAGKKVTLASGGLKPCTDYPLLFEPLLREMRTEHTMVVVLIDPFADGTRYSKYKGVADALRGASTILWGPPLVEFKDGGEVTDFRWLLLCIMDIVKKFNNNNPMLVRLAVFCEGGINRAAVVKFLVGMVMGVSFADMKATYDAAKVDRVLPEGQHGGTFEGISNRVFLGLLGQLAAVVAVGGDVTAPENWVLKAGTAVRASTRRGAGGAAVADAPAPAPAGTPKRKRKAVVAASAADDEGGDDIPPPDRTGWTAEWVSNHRAERVRMWVPPRGAAAVESPVVTPAVVVVVDDAEEIPPSLGELGRKNAVCPP